jgi:HKD family nuclease
MRYLDTGSRDPDQCLAKWLESILCDDIDEIRLQSGFFSANALGIFVPVFEKSRQEDRPVRVLVGSNDGATLRDDIAALSNLIGLPRKNGRLGIVRFAGSYFHPKTYHFRRVDGTEAAFVGSANLTMNGLSLHVEAGITLDTREGDLASQTATIAQAIDQWFDNDREGLVLIDETTSLEDLVASGVLSAVPPPHPAGASTTVGGAQSSIPRLKRLVSLPNFAVTPSSIAAAGGTGVAAATPPPLPVAALPIQSSLLSAPKQGLQPYFLFDPAATGPTKDGLALTGATLPSGVAGLILQLNKDSARYFSAGEGTANISLPIATVGTIRFGVYHGKYLRPRAEFKVRARYITNNQILSIGIMDTNVMGYGVDPAEPGHSDIRMLVPKRVIDIIPSLQQQGLPIPKVGDFAFLEWPNPALPMFRLSFLGNGSTEALQASALFQAATSANALVGGACWLSGGVSPAW